MTSQISHMDRNSSACNTAFILVFYLVNVFKELKGLP